MSEVQKRWALENFCHPDMRVHLWKSFIDIWFGLIHQKEEI